MRGLEHLQIACINGPSSYQSSHIVALFIPMASMGYNEVLLPITICLGFLFYLSMRKAQPFNWPLLGMLPILFFQFNSIFETLTKFLDLNNGTFLLKGSWFANMDMIITSNPSNVHHIMSKNFSNYPKGSESKRIFEVLGDMLFYSDLDEWKKDRKLVHAFLNDKRFHQCTPKITRNSMEKGLIPVLEHFYKHGLILDLQDLFERFMFDTTCMAITGYDPASLRIGFPDVAFSRAMDEASRAIFVRHLLPERVWMSQKWLGLGLGQEKILSKAHKTLDDIADKYITMRQEALNVEDDEKSFDALKFLLTKDGACGSVSDTYSAMRDTIIGLMFAGRDTASVVLTWFFWLISRNPNLESQIRKEMEENFPTNTAEIFKVILEKDVLDKLVYLHGALCETLRLFPPVPLQRRVAVKGDILPSGHHVSPEAKVVISSYAMGRMKSIWGEDCLEFKPERWLTEKGGIKFEPPNKFQAFSSGPRVCPGRDLAFGRMKAVAAAIIYNYNVQIVKAQPAAPLTSIVIHMKDGLKLKLTKRWA